MVPSDNRAAYKYRCMYLRHLNSKTPKIYYISFSFLSNPEQLWYSSFSLSSSSFLYLIHLSLLFLLIHQHLFAIHTNPLLCSISETLLLSAILVIIVICILILRRICGKWVQIVVGGMGSPVIQ